MSSDPEVLLLLGKIDGKLDQVISAAEEHRADDNRRFKEVFNRLDLQDGEINKAKGAKGVIVWVVGLIAGGISALVMHFLKIKGGQ